MSVLPSITDFDEMRRPVRFVPIARDTPPPLPLGSPVQFQTAVPACIQQLSALGPHLERGELWSRCLAHWYTPCRVPAMPPQIVGRSCRAGRMRPPIPPRLKPVGCWIIQKHRPQLTPLGDQVRPSYGGKEGVARLLRESSGTSPDIPATAITATVFDEVSKVQR